MLKRAFLPALGLLLMAGCSGSLQGPPDFLQTYGTVDEPCAASTTAVSHCTAHVYLINHGGEGVGLATVVVPVKDPTATASPARQTATLRCGGYIPATPNGGEVDLACGFDLPAGKAIAGPPILQAMKFSAAAGSSSSNDAIISTATFGLAIVAGLIAVVALVLAIAGRSGAGKPRARSASGARKQPDDDDDGNW